MVNPIVVAHGLSNPTLVVRVKNSAFTALNRSDYFCNTTAGSFTAQLPSNAKPGFEVNFQDYASTFDTYPLTVSGNGKKIRGLAEDYVLNQKDRGRRFVYVDDTKGWLVR